jgi:hypothetical protein
MRRTHAAKLEDIFSLLNDKKIPSNNDAILTNAAIIKAVMSSAAKDKLGALFFKCQGSGAVYLHQILPNGTSSATDANPNGQHGSRGSDKQ